MPIYSLLVVKGLWCLVTILTRKILLPWLKTQSLGTLILGGNFLVLLVMMGYSQFSVYAMHQEVMQTQLAFNNLVGDIRLISCLQDSAVSYLASQQADVGEIMVAEKQAVAAMCNRLVGVVLFVGAVAGYFYLQASANIVSSSVGGLKELANCFSSEDNSANFVKFRLRDTNYLPLTRENLASLSGGEASVKRPFDLLGHLSDDKFSIAEDAISLVSAVSVVSVSSDSSIASSIVSSIASNDPRHIVDLILNLVESYPITYQRMVSDNQVLKILVNSANVLDKHQPFLQLVYQQFQTALHNMGNLSLNTYGAHFSTHLDLLKTYLYHVSIEISMGLYDVIYEYNNDIHRKVFKLFFFIWKKSQNCQSS